jgi:hypothetical protein
MIAPAVKAAARRRLVATGFLTVEVCTINGLVTRDALFFVDIASRAVRVSPHPDSRWITQIARNLTDMNDSFLRGRRYLILDRDTKYSGAFLATVAKIISALKSPIVTTVTLAALRRPFSITPPAAPRDRYGKSGSGLSFNAADTPLRFDPCGS